MTTALTALPPVVCTQWCTDGTGHPDASESDEQFCRSASRVVELSAEQPGERARRVLVHLYRDAHEDVAGDTELELPHVEVGGMDTDTLRLSIREARALGQILGELADVADIADGWR
jgi:hypothetical protein